VLFCPATNAAKIEQQTAVVTIIFFMVFSPRK
jgi:hypothetical protein